MRYRSCVCICGPANAGVSRSAAAETPSTRRGTTAPAASTTLAPGPARPGTTASSSAPTRAMNSMATRGSSARTRHTVPMAAARSRLAGASLVTSGPPSATARTSGCRLAPGPAPTPTPASATTRSRTACTAIREPPLSSRLPRRCFAQSLLLRSGPGASTRTATAS